MYVHHIIDIQAKTLTHYLLFQMTIALSTPKDRIDNLYKIWYLVELIIPLSNVLGV